MKEGECIAKRVKNCALPPGIAGFVESENIDVALKALRQGELLSISDMGHVRDQNKEGAHYVYFRVMREGETPANMAFNSVGSGLIAYKARMEFSPDIWLNSTGGYVSTFDRKGSIGITPYDAQAQLKAFTNLLSLDQTTLGSAEVGIYRRVPMCYLRSIWCLFPCRLSKLQSALPPLARHRPQALAPAIATPGPSIPKRLPMSYARNAWLTEARQHFSDLASFLPTVSPEGAVQNGQKVLYWIVFSK